jgi:uncharacterized membrane protein
MNYWYLNLAIGLLLGLAALIGILLGIGNSNSHPTFKSSAPANVRTLTSVQSAQALIRNATVAVSPGAGWKLIRKTNIEINLGWGAGPGILGFLSGNHTNPQQFIQLLLQRIAKSSPDAKVCGKPQNANVPHAGRGVAIPVCYTIVPQNGQAIRVFTILLVSGRADVGVQIELTSVDNQNVWNAFARAATPVMNTVQWLLLSPA